MSRAVARLNTLCELCLPFLKVGGVFIAMKGPECAQEVSDYPVGTPLLITGRLQSRDYIKMIDGVAEQRTAYEISAITAELP